MTFSIQAVGKDANSAEEIFIIASLLLPGLSSQHVQLKGRSHSKGWKQLLIFHKVGFHKMAPQF